MTDYNLPPSQNLATPVHIVESSGTTTQDARDPRMSTVTTTKGSGSRNATVSMSAPPVEETVILVMGQGGVGKSSFISTLSNSTVRMSTSGTQIDNTNIEKLELSLPFYVDGKPIRLVDTPSFGDTTRSDTDVLTALASWLASEYANGRKIGGAIFLHNIAPTRLRGASRRNLSLFTKLTGKQALANVAVVTTRWDEVPFSTGEAREAELTAKPTLLKPILEAGAALYRYNRTQDAIFQAQDVIRHFLQRSLVALPLPLLIQQEMVDDSRTLPETTAGRALQKEYRAQLDEYQRSMANLRTEYDELKQEPNRTATAKKVKQEMILIKDAAEKLKEESRKLTGTTGTITRSQPLRLLITTTVPVPNQAPMATPIHRSASQSKPRRSSMSPGLGRTYPSGSAIPPLPQNPPSALRTPRSYSLDKGKGREVQPHEIPPSPAAPPMTYIRPRRMSARNRRESSAPPPAKDVAPRERGRSRRRRSSFRDDGAALDLDLDGWGDFRYALVGVVMFLVLIPFVRRYQALTAGGGGF